MPVTSLVVTHLFCDRMSAMVCTVAVTLTLIESALPSSTPPTSTPTRPSTSPRSSTAPPPAAGADAVLKQLDAAFTELQNAYKTGDLARIGEAQAAVQRLTKEYLALRGSPTATPTPSPTR